MVLQSPEQQHGIWAQLLSSPLNTEVNHWQMLIFLSLTTADSTN